MRRAERIDLGFSLIELVVALLFVGLLMAGMMKVFSASISSFHSQQETLGSQRMSRLAFDQLSDDFQQAGYMYPDRSTPPWITAGAAQKSFLINPGITFTALRADDVAAGSLASETITGDEVVFTRDVPLHVSATLSGDVGALAGLTDSLPLSIVPGGSDRIQKGDIAVILDQNFEYFFVKSDLGAGTSVAIDPDMQFVNFIWETGANPEVEGMHLAGTQVMFIRPNQLVRYSLQPIALDPAIPLMTVPCLVRQQAAFPENETTSVDWGTTVGTVLAENVSGFKVDISPDGGTSWTRTGAWSSWSSALDPKLKAQKMKGYEGMAVNPYWFKFANLVFRLDITSRSAMRRSEFNTGAAPARAFRERTMTMLLMPRNFPFGS